MIGAIKALKWNLFKKKSVTKIFENMNHDFISKIEVLDPNADKSWSPHYLRYPVIQISIIASDVFKKQIDPILEVDTSQEIKFHIAYADNVVFGIVSFTTDGSCKSLKIAPDIYRPSFESEHISQNIESLLNNFNTTLLQQRDFDEYNKHVASQIEIFKSVQEDIKSTFVDLVDISQNHTIEQNDTSVIGCFEIPGLSIIPQTVRSYSPFRYSSQTVDSAQIRWSNKMSEVSRLISEIESRNKSIYPNIEVITTMSTGYIAINVSIYQNSHTHDAS